MFSRRISRGRRRFRGVAGRKGKRGRVRSKRIRSYGVSRGGIRL